MARWKGRVFFQGDNKIMFAKGPNRNSRIIITALFMLLCLGCLYIYPWLFSQELDKHCKETVHKLYFSFLKDCLF